MAVNIKHVLEFQQNGTQAGWTEVWYHSGTSAGQDNPGDTLYTRRAALLGPTCQLIRDRVSTVNVQRSTIYFSINKLGTYGQAVLPLAQDDPAGYAVVCQVTGVNSNKRKLWLRGVSEPVDGLFPASGLPSFAPAFLQALSDYFSILKQAQWGILSVQPATQLSYVYATSVDGKTTPGTSVITFTTAIPAGIVAGSQVILGQFSKKDLPGLNGRFFVVAVGATTITVKYATPQNLIIPATSGRARLLTYNTVDVVDPTKSFPQYPGPRITRTNFSHSRGARRAARTRQSP